MRIIYPASPNQALFEGLNHLLRFGTEETSRNGTVIVSREPVMTIYRDPSARVLVGPTRDGNPFFHLVESMWMLAGRNDAKLVGAFVKNIANYSDDGVTLNGAYGHRWRTYFGYDQLQMIAEQIIADNSTRRAVLQMWDANLDDETMGDLDRAAKGSKDVPCNTSVYFDTLGGRLNMTVSCRSNDIIWGAYGANVVHFSILLEYMAAWTGLPMGDYRQFSNNYHAYTDLLPLNQFGEYAEAVAKECVYTDGGSLVWKINKDLPKREVYRVPLVAMHENVDMLDEDILAAMAHFDKGTYPSADPITGFDIRTDFFRKVFWPMMLVHRYFKSGELRAALEACNGISADDWREACRAWVQKRGAE